MASPTLPPSQFRSDVESVYSLNYDADSISVISDTSTLQSQHLNNHDSAKDVGYGKSSSPTRSDSPFSSDRMLSKIPQGETQNLARSRHRSRSPGHRGILTNHRHLSPHRYGSTGSEPTQLEALAGALGANNVPHTTELDSIPCAGIRIPNGPFSGLLAWRLVVRVHPRRNTPPTAASLKQELVLLPNSDIRHAGNMPKTTQNGYNHTAPPNDLQIDEKGKKRASLDAVNTLRQGPAKSYGPVHPGEDHVAQGPQMSELSTAFSPPKAGYQSRALAGRVSSESAASLPLPLIMGLVRPRNSIDTDVKSPDDDDGWNVLPSPTRPWGPSTSSPALVRANGGRASSHSPTGRRPLSSFFSAHPPAKGAAVPERRAATPPPRASTSSSRSLNPDAVVANFLFDTSIGHNTISRETLRAMGFSAKIIDALQISELPEYVSPFMAMGSIMAEKPSASFSRDGWRLEPKTVSLYIQNVAKPITFRLAPEGEPSRLGVQFLLESDVNVCMGEGGRGAIMWVDRTAEKKMLLETVPRTVPLPKLTLQAKVKALFGLS